MNTHTRNAQERGGECIKPPIPSVYCTEIMLGCLQLQPPDILMEIGTGSGSQTAVWQRYVKEVHSVELVELWKIEETRVLGPHVYLSYGDGAKGLPDAAPFDVIVVTCGVPDIPRPWIDQLKDGGRLVAPIGTAECQKLTLFRKKEGALFPERVAAYVRFVMMEKP